MKLLVIALTVTLLLLTAPDLARAGNSVGNAGDATAMEFKWMAGLAIKRLREAKLTEEQKTLLATIEVKLKTVTVASKPMLIRNGHEVDAINYPDRSLIEVSQSRWALMKKNTASSRMGFVVHELIGATAVDGSDPDFDYKLSEALLAQIRDERFADVAFEEALLNQLYSLSFDLQLASIRPEPWEMKEDDSNGYCVSAGQIKGQISVLAVFISNSSTKFSNPEKAFNQIREAARDIHSFCMRGHTDRDGLKARVKIAIEAIREIIRTISPAISMDDNTFGMQLEK